MITGIADNTEAVAEKMSVLIPNMGEIFACVLRNGERSQLFDALPHGRAPGFLEGVVRMVFPA